jgi:hypothetical protein
MVLTSCAQKVVNPNLKGLTGIDASSVFDITLTKGNSESLTIEADKEILPFVRHEVRGGILYLWLEKNKVNDFKKLHVSITMKELSSLNLSGACKLNGTGVFPSKQCKIDCSGAAKVNLQLQTSKLDVNLSGASNLQIDLQAATDVSLEVSGAAKVKISTPASLTYTNGTGKYTTKKIEKMNIECSGSSKIQLSGSAEHLNIELSGASKIDADQFKAKTAKINATGASKVTVGITEELKVYASGASNIQYSGLPKITALEVTGSAKLRKLD